MNIIFFGTPDFAVFSLKAIFNSYHKILAVVTAPDKERGRGRKVSFTPVKQFAIENGIEVLQPENLSDIQFIAKLKEFSADLFVIVAFRILPEIVFTMPKFGSFNLHGSILPKYRGAAPIQWAIINGEKKTGITTFFLQKTVDTGNIILQKEIEIKEEDDFGTLHDKMAEIGAKSVVETIDLISENKVNLQNQDDSLASKAPKITKEIQKIDWNNSSEKIVNQIRGLSPFPGAFFLHNGKIIKIWKAIKSDKKLGIGEILETKKQIFIGTNNFAIEILEIQPEDRKRMTSEEFLRGNSLIKG